jgi:hypothetical protein
MRRSGSALLGLALGRDADHTGLRVAILHDNRLGAVWPRSEQAGYVEQVTEPPAHRASRL